ncbi:MAG: T9SS type A sorting domain-containing protein [Bacteroidota bacterium]
MKQLKFFACLLVLLLARQLTEAQPVNQSFTLPDYPGAVGLDVPRPSNVICHNFFDVVASTPAIPAVTKQGNVHIIQKQIELAVKEIGLEDPHANDLHVLYFPQGTYRINQQQEISKNNVVIRGEGANKTIFKWEGSGQYCFNVLGPDPDDSPAVTADGLLNNFFVASPAASSSVPNGTLLLLTRDDPESSCNPTFTRQYARKVGDLFNVYVQLDTRLRIEYRFANNASIRAHVPQQFVGFECFKIDATGNSASGRNGSNHSSFSFQWAANCWIEGVESKKAALQHVIITQASNIEVRGCYFYDSHGFGDGQGYGINIQNGSGECLIENNIFKTLRHSILLQRGANGNAVLYNYSHDWQSSGNRSDMAFHGDYPFCNLVEGNSFERIHFDLQGECRNGPRNLVFRNKTTNKNILSGAVLNPGVVGYTGVVANETNQCINLYGSNSLYESYDNDESGFLCIGGHGPNSDNTPNGNSIMYATRPAFLNSNSFPTFGPGSASNSVLPAEQRASYNLKTVGGNCSQCRPAQPLAVSAQVINCAIDGTNTIPGFIYLNITGGQAPYSTSWGLFVYATTTTSAQFNNPTLWSATVTDNNGQSVLVSGFTGPCDNDDIFKTAETGHAAEVWAPESMALRAAPNPFRAATRLNLDLPERRDVTVDLYAIDGTLIRQIHRGSLNRGPHRLEISGTGLAPGLYFCRVRAGEERQVIRLVVQ